MTPHKLPCNVIYECDFPVWPDHEWKVGTNGYRELLLEETRPLAAFAEEDT